MNKFVNVSAVKEMEALGPWESKSGGKLMVNLAFSLRTLKNRYFDYKKSELDRIPEDIRGLRIYTVRELPKNKIGGTEFHRIREEIVFGLEGTVEWECEDVYGNKKNFVLTPDNGVWMPPFILHTYEAIEEDSGLLVMANTLFNPDDPKTHDTYSSDKFRELQKKYAKH